MYLKQLFWKRNFRAFLIGSCVRSGNDRIVRFSANGIDRKARGMVLPRDYRKNHAILNCTFVQLHAAPLDHFVFPVVH